jgi:uncharacterized protein YdeI (YjbR/CyaY-like superfamily)
MLSWNRRQRDIRANLHPGHRFLTMGTAKTLIHKGEPARRFRSASTWSQWLAKNHAGGKAIWIQYAKKGSGIASVTYAEAVEEALCFGWIDGQAASIDEIFYLQRFTPRRAKSRWSKINVAKAEALITAGRMQPAGLREVEAAQADGRWLDAYSGPSTAQVPEDLARALDAAPNAKKFFATLDSQNRYAILFRLGSIKRPETRARRITTYIEMLAAGKTLHPAAKRKK